MNVASSPLLSYHQTHLNLQSNSARPVSPQYPYPGVMVTATSLRSPDVRPDVSDQAPGSLSVNCSNLITVTPLSSCNPPTLAPPAGLSLLVSGHKCPPIAQADRKPRADPLATSEAASVRPGTPAETHQESQDDVFRLVSGRPRRLPDAPATSSSRPPGPCQRLPVRRRGGGQGGRDKEYLHHRHHQYSQRHSNSHHLHFYCVLRKQQVSAVYLFAQL